MKNFLKITAVATGFAVLSAGALLADEMGGKAMDKTQPSMTPAASKPKMEHKTKKEKKVRKNKKETKARKAMAHEKYVWVCPMGDYTGPRTKDGKCPSCHMELVKQKAAEGKMKSDMKKDDMGKKDKM